LAETIVDLSIDWSGIETLRDLQTGLQAVLGKLASTASLAGIELGRRKMRLAQDA
jgi:hypothetical protein